MFKRSILILLGLVLLVIVMPAYAQALPNSVWYTVVYQPETDTLRWINVAGEQTAIARPMLPNEAQYRDMRIAPNGQQMVMVSQLTNGLEAIGIYDFASGVFVQTHQANVGEQINLGGENIFSANSQYFAIGLFSGDFANPAWRVILLETQTGNAMAFIDHSHPDAPDVQLSAPAIQYLDGEFVHFQLIPQSVGGWHTWPAYAWRAFGFDPATPAISESPYSRVGVQVLPLTGQALMSFTDENYAVAPQDGQGSNFNAIGRAYWLIAIHLQRFMLMAHAIIMMHVGQKVANGYCSHPVICKITAIGMLCWRMEHRAIIHICLLILNLHMCLGQVTVIYSSTILSACSIPTDSCQIRQ